MGMPNALKCHICNPANYFDDQDDRSHHYQTQHPDIDPQYSPEDAWKCTQCPTGVNRYFDTCQALQTHIDREHP